MGFTPHVIKDIPFTEDDGTKNVFKVQFRRLKRKELLALSPHLPKSDDKGKVKVTLEENLVLLDKVSEIFPGIVESIEGPYPITVEQVIEEVYFMPLLGDIFKAVMEASNLGPQQAKNSNAPHSEASKA